jgi:hypothetical protein
MVCAPLPARGRDRAAGCAGGDREAGRVRHRHKRLPGPLLGKLDHPKGDAEALAQKLGELGFKVVKVLDRTKQQLRADLDAFVKGYRGADVVLVYVTGLGRAIRPQHPGAADI